MCHKQEQQEKEDEKNLLASKYCYIMRYEKYKNSAVKKHGVWNFIAQINVQWQWLHKCTCSGYFTLFT